MLVNDNAGKPHANESLEAPVMPALPATFRTPVNLFSACRVVREKLTLIACAGGRDDVQGYRRAQRRRLVMATKVENTLV